MVSSMVGELKDGRARSVISAAGDAARASYAEISQARNELNALEAEGVYVPGYLEDRRREAADRVAASVGRRLDEVRRRVESESSRAAAAWTGSGGWTPKSSPPRRPGSASSTATGCARTPSSF